jgi:hypothetical protein
LSLKLGPLFWSISGITLSRQPSSSLVLPHLAHFINITEGLKLSTAQVLFDPYAVVISMDKHSTRWRIGHFSLEVRCGQLDQQIVHAAQICRALIPALSGVEMLRLEVSMELSDPDTPMGYQTGEIDSTTWHELLNPFIGAKELRICPALSQELSRALQEDDVGSDPGFLPGLQELISEFFWETADAPFDLFIHARLVVGRPIRSSFLRLNPLPRTKCRFLKRLKARQRA